MQAHETVDSSNAAAARIEVVRRPAGGGAVLVAPGSQLWADFWVPRKDPLWDDDIVRSASWVGACWARALGSLGVTDVSMHDGRAIETEFSRTACFAGLGPGEVSVRQSKLVGVAQRRGREGARFFTVALLEWDPAAVLALLVLEEAERVQASEELSQVGTGLRDVLAHDSRVDRADALLGSVEDALLEHLP
jgi:lipoate-protein ligase A